MKKGVNGSEPAKTAALRIMQAFSKPEEALIKQNEEKKSNQKTWDANQSTQKEEVPSLFSSK
jgi:hypothetical protein